MSEDKKFSYEDFKMTGYLKKLTVFACGGPFLDGYILIIIGLALPQLTVELELSTFWNGMLAAAALVGIFVGSSVFGYITDKVGRNKMFTLDLIVLVVLSVLCMFINAPWQLFVLRLLIGVAIGADYPIATALITEFTPKKNRAGTMAIIAGVWYLGAAAAGIVGYFLSASEGNWGWMLASGAIPGLIILLGRIGTPESPVWLAHKGRPEEATKIVKKVFGPTAELDESEPAPEKTSFMKVFKPGYFKRTIFCGLIYICEFAPASAILLFGPTIMRMFGMNEGRMSIIGDVVVSMFFFIGCMVAIFFISKWGRRPLSIWSFALMGVCMAILAIPAAAGSTILVVIAFSLYALFSGVPGTLVWLYPNELFPTEIRATAVGVAVAMSRFAVVITNFGMPYSIAKFGISGTMLIGLGITVIGLIVCVAWAPETKGKTLAESSAL